MVLVIAEFSLVLFGLTKRVHQKTVAVSVYARSQVFWRKVCGLSESD